MVEILLLLVSRKMMVLKISPILEYPSDLGKSSYF